MNHIQKIQAFYYAALPEFVIHEYAHLIDSTSIQPENWCAIALDIVSHYDAYDGFVVLHGTDTLAYTASALSFMLEGLQKLVMCTGAQIPLSEVRSDAVDNIFHSLLLASDARIKEVCIYFDKKLMRANRTIKVNASSFDAFCSPNYPLLGQVNIDIHIHESQLLKSQSFQPIALKVASNKKPILTIFTLFPGLEVSILRKMLAPPLQGLVLKTYGVGNMIDSPEMLLVFKEASDRGVIIVNCTQCLKGRVNMKQYATGRNILKAGVLPGFDLTNEAAFTKLFYLLSLADMPIKAVKKAFNKDLRGEVTLPM